MCEKHYTGTVKNEERNSLKKQMGGHSDNNIKQENRQQNSRLGGDGRKNSLYLERETGKYENF